MMTRHFFKNDQEFFSGFELIFKEIITNPGESLEIEFDDEGVLSDQSKKIIH